MAEFAKQQGSVTQRRRPERAHLGGLSGMGFEPSGPGSVSSNGSAALDQEVLRDLRHAVGNHFHKLFYWADRLESETGSTGQVEELTGALQRFQEYLELGLGYFEPNEGSLLEMGLAEFADAAAKVVHDHLGATEVTLELVAPDQSRGVRVDPQRLSLALRLVTDLLGGPSREAFDIRIVAEKDSGVCAMRISARGGEPPSELPVLEWAIARKAIAVQGGMLARLSETNDSTVEGCVLRLPFGPW